MIEDHVHNGRSFVIDDRQLKRVIEKDQRKTTQELATELQVSQKTA